MTLDEIITDLQYGELSSHGMFLDTLSVGDKDKLIAHINICLTELYTRFPLLTKEFTLIQYSNITEYWINSKFAKTNTQSSEPYKYILDSDKYPFIDDLIRFECIYDEMGDEVIINNSTECNVTATPAMDMLQIPDPIDTNAWFVSYRANHPVVTRDTKTLLLPTNFKPALLAYVASRVYSGSSSQEHSVLSATLFQKYELFCQQQEAFGMVNKIDNEFNHRPCLGGWI